jgi:hypothetical protein
MTTTMAALNSGSIRVVEFVRLTMPTATYTFCNAASPITVNSITFNGLGSLLGISEIQNDIKANSADLKISLVGIDPANIVIILGADIKGSKIEVWRGFLDSNNQIQTISSVQQFFKRYQGIINNVAITEDFDDKARIRTATCIISSASMRLVLESRKAGIRTNPQSWKAFYPTDTSMDRVPIIASTYFDFGKEPKGGSQSGGNTFLGRSVGGGDGGGGGGDTTQTFDQP